MPDNSSSASNISHVCMTVVVPVTGWRLTTATCLQHYAGVRTIVMHNVKASTIDLHNAKHYDITHICTHGAMLQKPACCPLSMLHYPCSKSAKCRLFPSVLRSHVVRLEFHTVDASGWPLSPSRMLPGSPYRQSPESQPQAAHHHGAPAACSLIDNRQCTSLKMSQPTPQSTM
jgi:hypothetical protein